MPVCYLLTQIYFIYTMVVARKVVQFKSSEQIVRCTKSAFLLTSG